MELKADTYDSLTGAEKAELAEQLHRKMQNADFRRFASTTDPGPFTMLEMEYLARVYAPGKCPACGKGVSKIGEHREIVGDNGRPVYYHRPCYELRKISGIPCSHQSP